MSHSHLRQGLLFGLALALVLLSFSSLSALFSRTEGAGPEVPPLQAPQSPIPNLLSPPTPVNSADGPPVVVIADSAVATATPEYTPTPLPTPPVASFVMRSAALPPPPSSFYWGAWVDGAPFDMSKVADFEDVTGRKLDIIHWGQPWAIGGSLRPFQPLYLDQVRSHGALPLIDWASWDMTGGMDQPKYRLADIASGKLDSYIRAWASAAKDWGHPFFLRFNHEMNGWWFPWSEQINGNRPGDLVRAWQHTHNIFQQVGATNVTWVWCPNITGYYRTTPIAELYPGDQYVDWICMDGFNWGTDQNGTWQTFDQVFQHTYLELAALAPTKPIMIGETASSEKGGPLGRPLSKAAWITDTFRRLQSDDYQRIKALVWFNSTDSHAAFDWPLATSPESLDAFKSTNFPLAQLP